MPRGITAETAILAQNLCRNEACRVTEWNSVWGDAVSAGFGSVRLQADVRRPAEAGRYGIVQNALIKIVCLEVDTCARQARDVFRAD
jgi:hypothetical protein